MSWAVFMQGFQTSNPQWTACCWGNHWCLKLQKLLSQMVFLEQWIERMKKVEDYVTEACLAQGSWWLVGSFISHIGYTVTTCIK